MVHSLFFKAYKLVYFLVFRFSLHNSPRLASAIRELYMFFSLLISIYTLSDLGVLSNLIGLLSLANEHYSPPTE